MAVSKTFVLIVLAITFNQGSARPYHSKKMITKNDLASAEGFQMDAKGDIAIGMPGPAIIKKDLVITIEGTINTNSTTFIVELPSKSGKESCQLKYDYINDNGNIYITPFVDYYERADYNFPVEFGSPEAPPFALSIITRVDNMNQDLFGMSFRGNNEDYSTQLLCPVASFQDVDTIVIKDGVSRINSLSFEFLNRSNH